MFFIAKVGRFHASWDVSAIDVGAPNDHNIGLFRGQQKSSKCGDELKQKSNQFKYHLASHPRDRTSPKYKFQLTSLGPCANVPWCHRTFSSLFFPSLAEPALSGADRAVPVTPFGPQGDFVCSDVSRFNRHIMPYIYIYKCVYNRKELNRIE